MTKVTELEQKEYVVLLYGDVNLGIIDGSAIWLISMAETLAAQNVHVHVLLKVRPEKRRLLDRLYTLDNVIVHEPGAKPDTILEGQSLADRLAELDQELDAHAVIVRGRNACAAVAGHETINYKLWAYITDLPHPVNEVRDIDREMIGNIASVARRMFAQTPDSRAYLESIIPAACGKTLLLTPMVPDEFFVDLENQEDHQTQADDAVSLVYSGKFAPPWRTLEMCSLPELAETQKTPVKLTMIGDKISAPRGRSSWKSHMRAALDNPGVEWLGGLPREEALQYVARADLGLGWRAPVLDASLELSTKALEYAASGTPPILNRTRAHEALFGTDYPLFVEKDEIEEVLRVAKIPRYTLHELAVEAQAAVRPYSSSESGKRLRQYLDDAFAVPANAPATPTTVLLAGHDLKFTAELIESLQRTTAVNLEFDEWKSLHEHDEFRSMTRINAADVIFCEWAGKNAVWYSEHKKAHQKLIVRLHGFEVRAQWLEDIKFDAVDSLIVVSQHMVERVVKATGWSREKIHVVPNALATRDLARPKLPGSHFRIGMAGIVPFLKRPDRALEMFRKVIEADPRFTLHIRGRLPWEYPHVWKSGLVQEQYLEFFATIGQDPDLDRRISFERFGSDMASWFSKIGFMLSPSDNESFHLAPAEAMPSGTVPVVWEREGATDVFGKDFVVSDSTEAAERVLSLTRDPDRYTIASDIAIRKSQEWSLDQVIEQIYDILFG
ncbi:glycosyl transferase [Auritidibacter sp. NML120779]|nr:glycosyl transferase [Auritidibacter sp. NML120779]